MISTRGRYALRVMLDLAEHASEGNVALRDIAQRQVISKKYLEIIVRELVNANYVSGVSGKGGGYRLTKAPEEYTMYDILNLMETSLKPVACLEDDYPGCDRANR
ncbi:MAG: Rrf2 family transcriptional regulator, partial [Lachnospiraceae bacterium]|nr:Rrf2 family transcriptional regulator [Candidatus Equihabitans merdae]